MPLPVQRRRSLGVQRNTGDLASPRGQVLRWRKPRRDLDELALRESGEVRDHRGGGRCAGDEAQQCGSASHMAMLCRADACCGRGPFSRPARAARRVTRGRDEQGRRRPRLRATA